MHEERDRLSTIDEDSKLERKEEETSKLAASHAWRYRFGWWVLCTDRTQWIRVVTWLSRGSLLPLLPSLLARSTTSAAERMILTNIKLKRPSISYKKNIVYISYY